MSYFFTSESVSEGHPDKVADQISDSLLDEFLRRDPDSHVACETMVTTGLVMVSGEVTCDGYVEIQDTVRDVIRNIGYTKGSISSRPTRAPSSPPSMGRAATSTRASAVPPARSRGRATRA